MIELTGQPGRIETLCKLRDTAMKELSNIVKSANIIEAALKSSNVSPSYDLDNLINQNHLKMKIDSEMWHLIFTENDLYAAMDINEIKQLNEWLYSGKPPEFTATNISSVMGYFYIEKEPEIFNQVVTNTFWRLMNSCNQEPLRSFRIKKKFNIPIIMRTSDSREVSIDKLELINSMDKIISRLVGGEYIENQLFELINKAIKLSQTYESEIYSVAYKSRNKLTVELKIEWLADKINSIVGDWFEQNQQIQFSEAIKEARGALSQ